MESLPNLETTMLTVYLFVSDYLDAHPSVRDWRRSNNHVPALTDAEILTVALMQGYLGCATLKQTYRFLAANHRSAFPKLCSYPRFVARLHPLREMVGRLVPAALAQHKMPARV